MQTRFNRYSNPNESKHLTVQDSFIHNNKIELAQNKFNACMRFNRADGMSDVNKYKKSCTPCMIEINSFFFKIQIFVSILFTSDSIFANCHDTCIAYIVAQIRELCRTTGNIKLCSFFVRNIALSYTYAHILAIPVTPDYAI